MKRFFTLIFALLSFSVVAQNPVLRIVQVDTDASTATIKNFGTEVDISTYRFCSLIQYKTINQLSAVSGDYLLSTDEEVTILIDNSGSGTLNGLNATAADLGLYLPTGNFVDAAAMIDFVQWGAGDKGRENLAVSNGFWVEDDFISGNSPFTFNGGASDYGLSFWSTAPITGLSSSENSEERLFAPNILTAGQQISFSDPSGSITVHDLAGNIVYQGLQTNFDTSILNSGLYFLALNGQALKMVIK